MIAFLVGVATQVQTWATLGDLVGVPYPTGLVDFLDTSGVFAALGFAGGALGRSPWRAVGFGMAVEIVAFAGYYLTYDWAAGLASGVATWGPIAFVTAPVGALLGFGWRRGANWLLGLPLGFVLYDALVGLTAGVQYPDARQFIGPVLGIGCIAVVFALGAKGAMRQRLALVGATIGSALVITVVFALVLDPALDWLFSSCDGGKCPYAGPRWPWD